MVKPQSSSPIYIYMFMISGSDPSGRDLKTTPTNQCYVDITICIYCEIMKYSYHTEVKVLETDLSIRNISIPFSIFIYEKNGYFTIIDLNLWVIICLCLLASCPLHILPCVEYICYFVIWYQLVLDVIYGPSVYLMIFG